METFFFTCYCTFLGFRCSTIAWTAAWNWHSTASDISRLPAIGDNNPEQQLVTDSRSSRSRRSRLRRCRAKARKWSPLWTSSHRRRERSHFDEDAECGRGCWDVLHVLWFFQRCPSLMMLRGPTLMKMLRGHFFSLCPDACIGHQYSPIFTFNIYYVRCTSKSTNIHQWSAMWRLVFRQPLLYSTNLRQIYAVT